MGVVEIGKPHLRRLRTVWRSAGWPCQDILEAELLAAGLLERIRDERGCETVRVTDAGVHAIATSVGTHRSARDPHELLVAQVAASMRHAGRLTWRRLSLRAFVDGSWVISQPDVFSIRNTTVEAYAEPVVHEIKVRRADLLSDLRRPGKGAGYLACAAQCWYVLKEGIAEPDEIPPAYGVLIATQGHIDVARPAPHRPVTVPFATWMALARAGADPQDDERQARLGDDGGRIPGA